jgi:hypothetical protein
MKSLEGYEYCPKFLETKMTKRVSIEWDTTGYGSIIKFLSRWIDIVGIKHIQTNNIVSGYRDNKVHIGVSLWESRQLNQILL